jgi:predicted MPP superfamily phosphohydrolase
MIIRFLSLLIVLILTDVIVYSGCRRTFFNRGSRALRKFSLIYWAISVAFVLYFIIHASIIGIPGNDFVKYRSYFVVFAIFVLLYLPKFIMAIFILIDDLLHISIFIILRILNKIQRANFSVFMRSYRFLSYSGFFLGIILFFFTLYGITKGTTDFRVKEVNISYNNLPNAFDGFKIAHISDVHLGSFYYQESVEKGISLLNEQKPDVILMTGDMVNTVSDEASLYVNLFKNLKPAYGKYAVLGNHDMGDYMKWDTLGGQHSRTDEVANIETAMGFSVLRNTHVVLHKNNDSIVLAGVDNWGLPPFKKYGNLNQALSGFSPNAFTILLSHDPTHWDAEVVSKTKVALTLSGHTHAFQIGFDYGNIRWSPIFMKYKEYLGLYESGMQYLYVNPGFGFIGFAGRIGVPPEITIITLRKK